MIGEKKTILTRYGKIELSNSHVFCLGLNKFKISPVMQELMLFSGQSCIYEDAASQIERFTQVGVQPKQIERLVHHYGPMVCDALEQFQATRKKEKQDWETTYVMMDGSMILTRTEKWKEVKLGRLFRQSDLLETSKSRKWLRKSFYVAHLGKLEPFLAQMSRCVDLLSDPVFIADGAPWIWSWVNQYYPEAVQILDYYHATQYLWDFAKEHFRDEPTMEKWLERQKELLKSDRVGQVIKNIEGRPVKKKQEREQKKRILRYYRTHQNRMQYGTYLQDGLMVGSGPIESAHRTVIQERLKKSGQRWTIEGANAIIPLRVAEKSQQWTLVSKAIRNNAA
jgi:hypothetical protein